MNYKNAPTESLQKEIQVCEKRINDFKKQNLSLNMSRGKPSSEQLDLSIGLLDTVTSETGYESDGIDCRNYGHLEGLPQARKLMGDYLGVNPDQVIVGGQASLQLMYLLVTGSILFGINGCKPWSEIEKVRWICPSPGYDRHFAMCEAFGFELVPVDMLEDGPDMEQVKELVENDPSVKGMWIVPKYSNPTGNTYSKEVIQKLASLQPAAIDFRIYADNAYAVHHLYPRKDELINIYDAFAAENNENNVILFGSTSKITFAGGGISAVASSPQNMVEIKKQLSYQAVCFDKLNQLRHVRYFKNVAAIDDHMKKQAEILVPKFELVDKKFHEGFDELELAHWTNPNGGYFISFFGPNNTAKKIVALCKECGVVLTNAGAAYPYGKDPNDHHIRIAPTYPSLKDLELALDVFVVCAKYVALQQEVEEREGVQA